MFSWSLRKCLEQSKGSKICIWIGRWINRNGEKGWVPEKLEQASETTEVTRHFPWGCHIWSSKAIGTPWLGTGHDPNDCNWWPCQCFQMMQRCQIHLKVSAIRGTFHLLYQITRTFGSGRSPGEGNGYPLQYCCLENSMDRRALQATIYGVAKSQTQLSN